MYTRGVYLSSLHFRRSRKEGPYRPIVLGAILFKRYPPKNREFPENTIISRGCYLRVCHPSPTINLHLDPVFFRILDCWPGYTLKRDLLEPFLGTLVTAILFNLIAFFPLTFLTFKRIEDIVPGRLLYPKFFTRSLSWRTV